MTLPIIAYIDGGSRGNPGPAGYGVSIETSAGTIIEELTGSIGVATNNNAEYRGLIAALEYFVEHPHRDVIIRSDSQLLSLIHITLCRRYSLSRSRSSPYH